MKANALISILRGVPGNAELYFLNAERNCIELKCVEVEYPSDNEGEICINFALHIDEE